MVDEAVVVELAPAAEPPVRPPPELPPPPDGKLVADGEGEGNGVLVVVGVGFGVGVGVVVGEGEGLPEASEATGRPLLAYSLMAEPCSVYAA